MDGSQHPLAQIDWERIHRELTVYALFLRRTDSVLRGTGASPEDLASTVVVDLLRGSIQHDGRRPLMPLLKKALYNDFLDQKKSAAHRTTRILDEFPDDDGVVAGGLDSLASEEEPRDILFRKTVYEAIGGDQQLRDFACVILELNITKPALIASTLSISVDEVENLRKRLRRALAPVRARLGA